FQFFTDFHGDLAVAVREGRRREFARWRHFADPELREKIPDPNDPATFERSKLDWDARNMEPGRARLELIRHLLDIRAREIAPRLAGISGNCGEAETPGERGIYTHWRLGDGSRLHILVHLRRAPFEAATPGHELFGL